jgi:hypothetical protein
MVDRVATHWTLDVEVEDLKGEHLQVLVTSKDGPADISYRQRYLVKALRKSSP